ncbi:MAG: tetratricopeptide repeat protein, partial [Verrucomicrobiales bacterium]
MTSDGAAAQVVMSQTSQSLKSKFTRLALVVCLTLCLSLPQLAISQESELRDAWRQFPLSQSLAAQYFDAIDGDLNEAARTLRPRQNWEEAIMWSALLDLAGQDEEAIQELERVVEQVPDQAVAWEALARRLMREASRVAQASEAWTTCLSLTQNPDPQASTRLREASLWFERSGQVAEASQALERLIVINSDDIESRLRLVQLYQQQQQAQRAVIHLQSIATGGSANQRLEAVTSLAELATQAGDAPQAFEHWQTALHLLPWNHWRISSVLQAVMKTAPEPETIIAHWEAQHEKEPHDPKWLVFLAGAYRVQENLGEELRILERLRDVHEAGLQYGLRLVEVLELLDKPSLATWESLVDQYPDHWEAARGYADVLANQDQLEKALEFWEAYEERLAWRPMIEDWKLSYGAFTRLHEEQRIRVLENPQDSLERQAAVQAALDVGDTEEALGLIEQVAGR